MFFLSFLCGLHKVCNHIMARSGLSIYLSTRITPLSHGKPHTYALRTLYSKDAFYLQYTSKKAFQRTSDSTEVIMQLLNFNLLHTNSFLRYSAKFPYLLDLDSFFFQLLCTNSLFFVSFSLELFQFVSEGTDLCRLSCES